MTEMDEDRHAATGGAPLLLGLTAELHGQTLHAEICRAVLAARDAIREESPHPELNTNHPEAGTVLHWATAQRIQEAARAIIDCRFFALLNTRRGIDGSTALHIAAAEGLPNVVKAMLDHPSFNSVAITDRDGFTAMHGAAYRGHSACVHLILTHPQFGIAAGAQGNFDTVRPAGHWAREAAADYDMCTALHMAAAAGHGEICDTILRRSLPKSCLGDATNRMNATALHMAARNGHLSACSAILRHQDEFTAVNGRDARGFTSLHWAAQQARSDICAAILDREDFTAVESADLRGRTALSIAKENGYHEIRRLILKRLGPLATLKDI